MKKYRKEALIGAGAVLGLVFIAVALSRSQQPSTCFVPGDTIRVFQGQSFCLRLPRGTYVMQGGDGLLVLLSQTDLGQHTELALLVGGAQNDFVVQPLFIDTEIPGKNFQITVEARRV